MGFAVVSRLSAIIAAPAGWIVSGVRIICKHCMQTLAHQLERHKHFSRSITGIGCLRENLTHMRFELPLQIDKTVRIFKEAACKLHDLSWLERQNQYPDAEQERCAKESDGKRLRDIHRRTSNLR